MRENKKRIYRVTSVVKNKNKKRPNDNVIITRRLTNNLTNFVLVIPV